MNINLHIERLVLEGLPIEQRQGSQLQEAVETELARLLAAGGLGESYAPGGSLNFVSGGPIHLDLPDPQRDPQGATAGLGQQIASALSASLGPAK